MVLQYGQNKHYLYPQTKVGDTMHLSLLCRCRPRPATLAATFALHTFLVCTLQPTALIQSFSNLGHMLLAPRSRCQLILGALRFHFSPLGSQMRFSCGQSRDLSFRPILFIFTPNMRWTRVQMSMDFLHPRFHLQSPGGQICLFLVYTVNPRVFN